MEDQSSPVDLDRLVREKLEQGTGIYTKTLAKAVHEVKKPFASLRMGVTELGGNTLGLVLWENQIKSLNDYQRGDVMLYAQRVKNVLELHGVDCTYVAVEGDPPNMA